MLFSKAPVRDQYSFLYSELEFLVKYLMKEICKNPSKFSSSQMQRSTHSPLPFPTHTHSDSSPCHAPSVPCQLTWKILFYMACSQDTQAGQ